MIRYDYFITDEFNDMWNEEPLATFKQAVEWRNFIKPFLNSPRTLRIISEARAAQVIERITLKPKKEYMESSEF